MNWKLIGQLSLFGLAMGVATVFVIPSSIEPLFWLVIFVISAYLIAAKTFGNYFLHGVLVGLANSVWVTASHILLFERYIANHPKEAAMMTSMPLPERPRLMMAVVGPVIGLAPVSYSGFSPWWPVGWSPDAPHRRATGISQREEQSWVKAIWSSARTAGIAFG